MRPCEVGRGDEEDGRFQADPTLSKGGDGRVDSIVGVERNQGGCRLTAKGGGGEETADNAVEITKQSLCANKMGRLI